MSAPKIVFAHANSFPAGTYRLLFEHWRSAGYEVLAPERLGHDPRYPVASNWRQLRDELLSFIEAQASEPVYLVGHSLGGLLSLMAACKRPELARGLVMLDSPIITGWRAQSVHLFKRAGIVQHIPPGKIAQGRRYQWPDRPSVRAHFVSKPLFARWDPRVLDDYVACGVVPGPQGVELAFRREIEAQIYNTLPHHLGSLMRRHPPRCPVGFIAGTQSVEMRRGGSTAAQALAGERFLRIEGPHLFPMEQPEQTAELVRQLLASMP